MTGILVTLSLPFVAALSVLFCSPRISRVVTVSVGSTVTALGIAALAGAQGSWHVDVSWIPALGARFALSGDAISWSLVALSGFLIAVAIGGVPLRENATARDALFLAMLGGLVLAFLARDLLLFYFGFEIALVPMYFLIARWGERERLRAAITFFMYTRVGSLAMLLGLIALALAGHGFAYAAIVPVAGRLGAVILAALIFGFSIKLPIAPLHLWLPLAHTEAPTEGSVALAGLLLKLGGYGLIRFALPALPQTFAHAALGIALWGAFSSLWGVLAAFAQRDLKRLVAYTSVNHMGYVLVAIAVAAAAGPQSRIGVLAIAGASLEMISHGLLTGGLFLIVGQMQQRFKTRDIGELRGIIAAHPRTGWTFAVLALGSLGIPLLSGFAAEVQIILATLAVYPWIGGLVALGVALTTALFAWTLQRVAFGEPSASVQVAADGYRWQLAFPAALIFASLLLGIMPRLLVDGYAAAAKVLRIG